MLLETGVASGLMMFTTSSVPPVNPLPEMTTISPGKYSDLSVKTEGTGDPSSAMTGAAIETIMATITTKQNTRNNFCFICALLSVYITLFFCSSQ
jgi:hypothetical protein